MTSHFKIVQIDGEVQVLEVDVNTNMREEPEELTINVVLDEVPQPEVVAKKSDGGSGGRGSRGGSGGRGDGNGGGPGGPNWNNVATYDCNNGGGPGGPYWNYDCNNGGGPGWNNGPNWDNSASRTPQNRFSFYF